MANHITVTPVTGPVTISAGGSVLGTSTGAVELREGSYPAVLYVPRRDIDMELLEQTQRATSCPWKGKASYYSVKAPADRLENVVWSYEAPLVGMEGIAGHLAFYPAVTVTPA